MKKLLALVVPFLLVVCLFVICVDIITQINPPLKPHSTEQIFGDSNGVAVAHCYPIWPYKATAGADYEEVVRQINSVPQGSIRSADLVWGMASLHRGVPKSEIAVQRRDLVTRMQNKGITNVTTFSIDEMRDVLVNPEWSEDGIHFTPAGIVELYRRKGIEFR